MKIVNNLKKMFFLLCIPFASIMIAEQENIAEKYSKTSRTTPYTCPNVMFVENKNKEGRVLKQYENPETAVHEAACAEILEGMGINTNHVTIVPAGHPSTRNLTKLTTTIHTIVPGKEVAEINDRPVLDVSEGLTADHTLSSIAKDNRLAPMVAVDTYLDDPDRNVYNIFFDEETDQFYSIDKGNAFYSLYRMPNDSKSFSPDYYGVLATHTNQFLEGLQSTSLSLEEIIALKAVKKSLCKVMDEYPPLTLQEKWIETAQKAHYEYTPAKQEHMLKFFEHNFRENCSVVTQLDKLTKSSHKLSLNNFRCVLQGMKGKIYENFI